MAKFGVMPAEDASSVWEGEIRRINLGERVVVEIEDGAVDGFPGDVYATEEEASIAATAEAVAEPGSDGGAAL